MEVVTGVSFFADLGLFLFKVSDFVLFTESEFPYPSVRLVGPLRLPNQWRVLDLSPTISIKTRYVP